MKRYRFTNAQFGTMAIYDFFRERAIIQNEMYKQKGMIIVESSSIFDYSYPVYYISNSRTIENYNLFLTSFAQ